MNKFKYGFFAFFLIEIAAFVVVGELVGLLMTLLLVVITTVLGFAVIRNQGLAAAYQSVRNMQGGYELDPENRPNPLKMIAGLLLVIPGFVTDAIGLLLLLPPLRRLLEKRMLASGVLFDPRQMGSAANEYNQTNASLHQGETIDGEFERKDRD